MNGGSPYVGNTLDVTDSISKNYSIMLSVDALLVDQNVEPIVDNTNDPIDYSGSGWK